jgi:hypothetical protein
MTDSASSGGTCMSRLSLPSKLFGGEIDCGGRMGLLGNEACGDGGGSTNDGKMLVVGLKIGKDGAASGGGGGGSRA